MERQGGAHGHLMNFGFRGVGRDPGGRAGPSEGSEEHGVWVSPKRGASQTGSSGHVREGQGATQRVLTDSDSKMSPLVEGEPSREKLGDSWGTPEKQSRESQEKGRERPGPLSTEMVMPGCHRSRGKSRGHLVPAKVPRKGVLSHQGTQVRTSCPTRGTWFGGARSPGVEGGAFLSP